MWLTCFQFYRNRLRVFRAVWGQTWEFPIDFDCRPYNRSALLCCLSSSSEQLRRTLMNADMGIRIHRNTSFEPLMMFLWHKMRSGQSCRDFCKFFYRNGCRVQSLMILSSVSEFCTVHSSCQFWVCCYSHYLSVGKASVECQSTASHWYSEIITDRVNVCHVTNAKRNSVNIVWLIINR